MSEVNPVEKWREDGIMRDSKQDEIDRLRAELEAAKVEVDRAWKSSEIFHDRLAASQARVVELENKYRHTHVAHYKTVGDQDILTDICDECGEDLRDDIHSPAPSAAPEPKEDRP